jgi:hypothetical protein
MSGVPSMAFLLEHFRPDLPGPERLAAFYGQPTYWQLQYWKDVEAEIRRRQQAEQGKDSGGRAA